MRKCASAGLWEAAFSKGPFPYNGGIYLKTQLESQLNPSADEREAEKKAKQKRRRKKPAAQASQVPQSSSQNTAGAAPEAPAPTQPPKKRRTSPYPGQVMPSLFSRRAGISSAGSAAASDKAAEAAPAGGKKKKQPSKKKSAQPQKLPITPAPSALTSPAALGRQSSPKRKAGAAVRIISLGGLHEIGKNMTVIEYGADIVVVDCGLAFPDETMPGVDAVIPDVSYLVKNADKVRGIFITHGHEDHTGALPYVLRQLNVPIYGTRLTCGLIRSKLQEHRLLRSTKLHEVRYGDVVEAGCFSVEIIRSNHSIPDACALCIRTPLGNIVHTGDFKIDPTPIDGEMMDLARLGEIGKEGVLALISDSTNAERPGYTKSERTVGAALDRIIASTDKRIIVTTFASNIHRVKQIIDAAEKNGRKVAVSGRSMVNNVNAAIELGVIDVPPNVMVDIQKVRHFPPEQLVIVTTGSQGEPLSALYRMAFADHKNVAIGDNDLVIISASPVPGNEEMVSNVINELMRRGAEVITNKQADIHVSGHCSQEEQKLVIGLTHPRYFLPMHGEMRHMIAHAKTAQAMGVEPENIVLSEIGKVIELSEKGWRFGGSVPSGQILIDGSGIGDVGNVALRDRKNLAENGLIVVTATLEKGTHRLLAGPELLTRGFVYVKEADELMDHLRAAAKEALVRCCDNNTTDWSSMKNELKDAVSSAVYKKTKRSPIILPMLMEV